MWQSQSPSKEALRGVMMKPKFWWRCQDIGDANTVGHMPREAVGFTKESQCKGVWLPKTTRAQMILPQVPRAKHRAKVSGVHPAEFLSLFGLIFFFLALPPSPCGETLGHCILQICNVLSFYRGSQLRIWALNLWALELFRFGGLWEMGLNALCIIGWTLNFKGQGRRLWFKSDVFRYEVDKQCNCDS